MAKRSLLEIDPKAPTGRLVGYARVSREEQSTEMQIDRMLEMGIARADIHVDSASGRTLNRKGFITAMKHLREGDTLVIWRLDRLSRNVHDMTGLIKEFRERGIALYSITDRVDITSPAGRLVASMMGAVAEYEVEVMSERTKAGQQAGRDRGYEPGRPSLLTEEEQIAAVKELHDKPKAMLSRDWREVVAAKYGIGKATLGNYDKKHRRALTKSRREPPKPKGKR